jgi:hypothetical protein
MISGVMIDMVYSEEYSEEYSWWNW